MPEEEKPFIRKNHYGPLPGESTDEWEERTGNADRDLDLWDNEHED